MAEPSKNDVKCGRGRGNWLSPGNQYLAELIRQNRQRYEEGQSKTEKSRVVEAVFSTMQQNGSRFMKMDANTGNWFEINDSAARAKVAHGIRDYIKSDSLKQQGDKSTKVLAAKKPTSSEKRKREQRASAAELDQDDIVEHRDKKMSAIPPTAGKSIKSSVTGGDAEGSGKRFPGNMPPHLRHPFNVVQHQQFPEYSSLPNIAMQSSSQRRPMTAGAGLESTLGRVDIMGKSSATADFLQFQDTALPARFQTDHELRRGNTTVEGDDKTSAVAVLHPNDSSESWGESLKVGVSKTGARPKSYNTRNTKTNSIYVGPLPKSQQAGGPTVTSTTTAQRKEHGIARINVQHAGSMSPGGHHAFLNPPTTSAIGFGNFLPVPTWPLTPNGAVHSTMRGDLPLDNIQSSRTPMPPVSSQVAQVEGPILQDQQQGKIYDPHHGNNQGATQLLLQDGSPPLTAHGAVHSTMRGDLLLDNIQSGRTPMPPVTSQVAQAEGSILLDQQQERIYDPHHGNNQGAPQLLLQDGPPPDRDIDSRAGTEGSMDLEFLFPSPPSYESFEPTSIFPPDPQSPPPS